MISYVDQYFKGGVIYLRRRVLICITQDLLHTIFIYAIRINILRMNLTSIWFESIYDEKMIVMDLFFHHYIIFKYNVAYTLIVPKYTPWNVIYWQASFFCQFYKSTLCKDVLVVYRDSLIMDPLISPKIEETHTMPSHYH